MRIALVYPGYGRAGGVERVVYEAARHLAPRHDVTVVCRDGDPDLLPSNVRRVILRVPSRPSLAAPLAFRTVAGRALAGLDVERVVSFGSDCPDSDVLVVQSVHAAWLNRGRPVSYGPLTVSPGFRRILPRHQVRLYLEKRAMTRSADTTIVPVSEGTAVDLGNLYGIKRNRMRVVTNGFDPEQFSPHRRNALRSSLPQQYKRLSGRPTLVMVANEWHRKGLGVLLEAMHKLPEVSPSLILVGRLPLKGYEHLVKKLGLQGRVHYLGAMEDVATAYAIGDLFVLPTQYEAFGNVIIEALASGVPVVTTELAGAASAVRPGENGLLQADPDDSDELAHLLRQALAPDVLDRWAKAAPDSVTGFEWGTVMQDLEAAIVGSRE